jgi:hypothetical protein
VFSETAAIFFNDEAVEQSSWCCQPPTTCGTEIVHDMMKEIKGYDISHWDRHSLEETTEVYKRDYDITLNRIYGDEDLEF